MHVSLIFASALTQALLNSLWQGALLALLATLLLGVIGRRSAALKHAIGMVFLLAIAVLPLATLVSLLSAGSVTASTGLAASAANGASTFEPIPDFRDRQLRVESRFLLHAGATHAAR